MKHSYDVVVIGAGSGGLTAAVGSAKIGKKTLLIEREHMGGECTNTGCIPSKALLHRAKEFRTARMISGTTEENERYRRESLSYVRETIGRILAEETPETFRRLGIDVVIGDASFVTPCSVRVGDDEYAYKRAIIATGSSPRMLSVPGLDAHEPLTNQNLFSLEAIPARTLVIGAGPIGLEMGQALALLGSHVTIATIDTEFARLEDPLIRPILERSFAAADIDIRLNANLRRIEGDTAIFDIDGAESRIGFDRVLIAIGRVPNLPTGLEKASIAFDAQGIKVDSQHRTSNKYVYAIGDVAQRLKFTHTADDTARQVIARIASRGWLRLDGKKSVPKVTYTLPEVAQVGLSYEAAKERYHESQLMRIEVPFSKNDRAKTDAAEEGVLVVIARRLNGAVLGAHIIGPNAGEIIALFTLAIDEKISLWKLQKLIFAYPTYSLIVKKAADAFVGRQLAELKTDLGALLARHLPQLFLGALWAVLLFQLYAYQTSHDLSVTDTAFMVFDFVSMTIWGPLLYILAYAIRPLTFFPGTALTILSGVFFGLWYGILYTIIAANLSAMLAYFVGRFFGKDLRLEDTVIGNWVNALQKNPFEAILTTRLIFLPFDLVSYAAGILRVAFLPFVFATFVGTLLGIATFVSIGASLDVMTLRESGFGFAVIDARFIALSAVIFVVSLVVSKFTTRWKAAA